MKSRKMSLGKLNLYKNAPWDWNIYIEKQKFKPNASKYSSPMEHLGDVWMSVGSACRSTWISSSKLCGEDSKKRDVI